MSANLLHETIFTNQSQAEYDMCYYQTVKAGATPKPAFTQNSDSSSTVSIHTSMYRGLYILAMTSLVILLLLFSSPATFIFARFLALSIIPIIPSTHLLLIAYYSTGPDSVYTFLYLIPHRRPLRSFSKSRTLGNKFRIH